MKRKQTIDRTPYQRARWLLALPRFDPFDHLSLQEQERLCSEMAVFVNPTARTPTPIDDETAAQWLKKAQNVLTWLRRARRYLGNHGRKLGTESVYWLHAYKNGKFIVRAVTPCPFNKALIETLYPLQKELRRCKRGGCPVIFVRSRRQRYCSRQCQAREWMRARRRQTKEHKQE